MFKITPRPLYARGNLWCTVKRGWVGPRDSLYIPEKISLASTPRHYTVWAEVGHLWEINADLVNQLLPQKSPGMTGWEPRKISLFRGRKEVYFARWNTVTDKRYHKVTLPCQHTGH